MDGLWTKHRPPVDGLSVGSTWSLLDLSGLTAAAFTQMAPIHEAGHAVIGLRHRQELAEVVIDDNAGQATRAMPCGSPAWSTDTITGS